MTAVIATEGPFPELVEGPFFLMLNREPLEERPFDKLREVVVVGHHQP
jgi:hypothetical protein